MLGAADRDRQRRGSVRPIADAVARPLAPPGGIPGLPIRAGRSLRAMIAGPARGYADVLEARSSGWTYEERWETVQAPTTCGLRSPDVRYPVADQK